MSAPVQYPAKLFVVFVVVNGHCMGSTGWPSREAAESYRDQLRREHAGTRYEIAEFSLSL